MNVLQEHEIRHDEMRWAGKVDRIFYDAGIPREVWATIMMRESSANPEAIGDQGTSFGLFQMNVRGGLGTGFTQEQLFNPELNAFLAARSMEAPTQEGIRKGLTGLNLVRYVAPRSGFPTFRGVLPAQYDEGLPRAYKWAREWIDENLTGRVQAREPFHFNRAVSQESVIQRAPQKALDIFYDLHKIEKAGGAAGGIFDWQSHTFKISIILLGLIFIIFGLMSLGLTQTIINFAAGDLGKVLNKVIPDEADGKDSGSTQEQE